MKKKTILRKIYGLLGFVALMLLLQSVNVPEVKAASVSRIEIICVDTPMNESLSYSLPIGSGEMTLAAKVHLDDGTIARNNALAQVSWSLDWLDMTECKSVITYSGMDTNKKSDTYGCSIAKIYVPFGEDENTLAVMATSKVDTDIDDSYYIEVVQAQESFSPTSHFRYSRGKVKIGNIRGSAPKVQETWIKKDQRYRLVLPKVTYSASDYTFTGWIYHGKIYQPGAVLISTNATGENDIITARWTGKFYTPNSIKVTRKSASSLSLSWKPVSGAKGYVIYRANRKNGTYKKVKTISKNTVKTWTNKSLKAGETYYYKVLAYKKQGSKTIRSQRSYYVSGKTVTGSSATVNAKKVTVNKSKVTGVVGKTTRLKAKVKAEKTVMNKKVRWFSSNSGIAKINKKTGKLTFVKKGTCYVLAKAHNGKNSKRVKVIVK